MQRNINFKNLNNKKMKNTIPELVTDTEFRVLSDNHLIEKKALRNYLIQRTYKTIRSNKTLSPNEIIHRLAKEHKLQTGTIRKICYMSYEN